MPAATTSVSGYLTSTDWTTFNGKGSGTVTSVGSTGSVNGITLTGTVTSSGSLTLGGALSGVSLSSQVTGNLPVTNLNSGTSASSSTFWRGDGIWSVLSLAGGVYTGSATRSTASGSGTVAYTGVGFKPSLIVVFMAGGLGASDICWGFSDGTRNQSIFSLAGGVSDATNLMWDYQGPGINQVANLSSFDSDGFTLSWTKNGAPTGTIVFKYLCIR